VSERIDKMTRLLTEALTPVSLQIDDDSQEHYGHGGYDAGGSHFSVTIVSPSFSNLDTVSRHRMIYDALGDMMKKEIHALKISAHAPDEI